jgi:hypothetical protein
MSASRIEQSLAICDWIRDRLHKMSGFQADGKTEWLVSNAFVAWQHHRSIATLFELELTASATALMRPLAETVSTGAWLEGLSAEDLDRFRRGQNNPPSDPVKKFKKREKDKPGAFRNFKTFYDKYRKGLDDLTHGGAGQLAQHMTTDGIQSKIDSTELARVLDKADVFALWAFITAANANVTQQPLAMEAIERVKEVETRAALRRRAQGTTGLRSGF